MSTTSNVQRRADDIFAERLRAKHCQTDRLFAVLFALQWAFAVGCACVISPRTWTGSQSYPSIHVWAAVAIGGVLAAGPVVAVVLRPGTLGTRMMIAVAQVLYSGLLIHLTNGRIETHFHVFGSLAILAFYRDWRLFPPATLVVFADHMLRAVFWPESVFGVIAPAPWRALEHAGWVVFEVVFLVWGCRNAVQDLRTVARTQAEIEDAKAAVETKVQLRTEEVFRRSQELEEEMKRRQSLETQLLQAQKLESIGQLAAGIAHEINTPMQFVSDNIEYLCECCDRLFEVVDVYEHNLVGNVGQKSWEERKRELQAVIEKNQFASIRAQVPQAIEESLEGIRRVINIVRAMKEFSHQGQDEKIGVDLNNAVRSTVMISRNRWKYVAELEAELDPNLPTLRCVPAEINQVLLNLVVNAADAVGEVVGDRGDRKGRIVVRTRQQDNRVAIEVEDSGCGIPDEIRSRIFDPFFTTKDVGKGTGQGLAICYNIVVVKHRGTIEVESKPGAGTTFRVWLPLSADGEKTAPSIPAIAATGDALLD